MNLQELLKKHWVAIFIISIMLLGFYIRVADYPLPYLRNIDSYSLYRQMKYIVDNNGAMPVYDDLLLVPEGFTRGIELFPYQYLGVYSYLFARSFVPGLELWRYLIYFPAILAALAAIPMYYIGKMLYNKKAGILAAFFIVFDVSNMSRSMGGDPDTDAVSILFALIAMAVFLKTYKHISEKKKIDRLGLFYTALTGIALGLYNHIWIGYWYIVWIITGMIIAGFIFDSLLSKSLKTAWNNRKHIFFSYFIFMAIFILVFVLPFYGINRLVYTFTGPIEFSSIKTEEGRTFPNVYVSVAELQTTGGIKDIIERTSTLGGPAIILSPFFLMVYAIIYLIYSFYKTRMHMDTVILLLIWFLGPLLATLVAVRFSILFSAPMAIGSGIILSKILDVVTTKSKIEE